MNTLPGNRLTLGLPGTAGAKMVDSGSSNRWDSVELLWDSRRGYRWFPQHPCGRIHDRELRALFGSEYPPPNLVALHDAGPGEGVPVLLVPGATRTAHYFLDPCEDGRSGLPQYLKAAGKRVFALSFSHSQDDNFQQAAQIGNAIARIRELTGSARVDVVAHSKGGIPARICASRLKPEWSGVYDGGMRRLLLVGVPNGGVDYFFRFPQVNRFLLKDEDSPLLNWPTTWERMLGPQGWVDLGQRSYGAPFWPGQRQLLARWDREYPLPEEGPDWETTYFGGEGEVSGSPGIDHYLKQGENMIDLLRHTPVDASVEVFLLAGDSPTMPNFINDLSGPGDGIIYLESALEIPRGTTVSARQTLPLHHKELICAPEALRWIGECLGLKDRATG